MRTIFSKLANAVGIRNAYVWMCEKGFIDESFVEQLSFDELEAIFGTDGKELTRAGKGSIIDLMARKAEKPKEFMKMYMAYLKSGNDDRAEYFLGMVKEKALLADWSWLFSICEIKAVMDSDYAKGLEIAKETIMQEIFNDHIAAQ